MTRDSEKTPESAFRVALEYLCGRSASCRDVGRMLKRRGFSDSRAAEVLERLKGLGYLDDSRFAAEWTALRSGGRRTLGREGMRIGLMRKGIHPDLAAEAASGAMTPEQEVRAAAELARLRAAAYSRLDPETRKRRLWSYLARRGFPASAIARAVDLDDSDLGET